MTPLQFRAEMVQAREDFVTILWHEDPPTFARSLSNTRLRWLAGKIITYCAPTMPEEQRSVTRYVDRAAFKAGALELEKAAREQPTSPAGAVFNEVLRRDAAGEWS